MSKAAHVRRAKQTRKHTCHWPTCEEQVPPAMWGCKRHWFALPLFIRKQIWATYQAGQEEPDGPEVTQTYLDVADLADSWAKAHPEHN